MKGDRGRGTLEKEKPPIFGMLQRTGEVVIRMLANVQQATISPLIKATIAAGRVVYTDEYDIYSRLGDWGFTHHTVCHGAREYARDDDGTGSARCMSTRWKDSGRCCGVGFALTEESRKKACRCT